MASLQSRRLFQEVPDSKWVKSLELSFDWYMGGGHAPGNQFLIPFSVWFEPKSNCWSLFGRAGHQEVWGQCFIYETHFHYLLKVLNRVDIPLIVIDRRGWTGTTGGKFSSLHFSILIHKGRMASPPCQNHYGDSPKGWLHSDGQISLATSLPWKTCGEERGYKWLNTLMWLANAELVDHLLVRCRAATAKFF